MITKEVGHLLNNQMFMLFRVIQRSVPPPLPLYSKTGKCREKSKAIARKYRQKYVICKTKQSLTLNVKDFLVFESGKKITDIRK